MSADMIPVTVYVGGDNDDALELCCEVCQATHEAYNGATLFELAVMAAEHMERRHVAPAPAPWPAPVGQARWWAVEVPAETAPRTIRLLPPQRGW